MKIRVSCPSDVFLGEVDGEVVAWEEANGTGKGEINDTAGRQVRTLLTQHQASGPFALEFADGTRFHGCNFVTTPGGKFVYITMPDDTAAVPLIAEPIEMPRLDVFQAEFYRWIEQIQSRPEPEPTTVLAIQHLERWSEAMGHRADFDRARPILAAWISAHFGQPGRS